MYYYFVLVYNENYNLDLLRGRSMLMNESKKVQKFWMKFCFGNG